jgi:heme-degrading monooxygenase HmoA
MVVTVFRSRLEPDHAAEYAETAARMRALAQGMPGFVSFKTFRAEDGECVSVIEFESEEVLAAWRNHPAHREAQQRGRAAFYAEFQIQVCSVVRQYGFKRSRSSPSGHDESSA